MREDNSQRHSELSFLEAPLKRWQEDLNFNVASPSPKSKQNVEEGEDGAITEAGTGQDEEEVYTYSSLEGLSIDVLAWLLSYLPVRDYPSTSLVSKRLLKACRANSLWKLKFEDRWNIDATFRVAVSGQNWYKAYQEAYHNPHDLWIFHWNVTFPQDGLAPGRCCIYDFFPNNTDANTSRSLCHKATKKVHNLCPRCRFFPGHPLKHALSASGMRVQVQNQDSHQNSPTEAIAQATDKSIRDFSTRYSITPEENLSDYSPLKAKKAFLEASTFHRTLNARQYTASTPRYESDSTTCLAQLQDLLFFNVTEEPLSTVEGAKELQHLRDERNRQQQWEEKPPFCGEHRRSPPQDFLKPSHETAHHTWHQAVITNPDFCRPVVFRCLVQRPDCFVVFPSEGFLEAGQSKVITFGVRPLGSLVATAFETINAQRNDVPDWMKQVYEEEGILPTQPFVIRYKYSCVIPCVPARGFISPHEPQPTTTQGETEQTQPQPQASVDDSSSTAHNNNDGNDKDDFHSLYFDLDYHWSGGDPSKVTIEAHEVRCIYLSAHVNAHYPFGKFRGETLTPFELSLDPATYANNTTQPNTRMLYFVAPQLYEFYPQNVHAQLQQVRLETEVSHAGQVFRSHRHKCLQCRRASWGPRLEEMGQAFVLATLEDWAWQQRQTNLLQNGIIIVRSLYKKYQTLQLRQQQQIDLNSDHQAGDNDGTDSDQFGLVRTQQLLYVVQKVVLRYRAAPFVSQRLRIAFSRLEILVDLLYGINMPRIQQSTDDVIPWRICGYYRHATCTLSVFGRQQFLTIHYPQWDGMVKEEPKNMNAFRRLLNTPGLYTLEAQFVSPQDESHHLNNEQHASAVDMFMDDPIQTLRFAIIALRNPRSILGAGIYDRVPYPGKVVRRPKIPCWFPTNDINVDYNATIEAKSVFYHLQDALDLRYLVPPSSLSPGRSFSLRRYLRNIPPLGMARFPVCIDDGCVASRPGRIQNKDEKSQGDESSEHKSENGQQDAFGFEIEEIQSSSACRIVPLSLPKPSNTTPFGTEQSKANPWLGNLSLTLQSVHIGTVNQRQDEPFVGNQNNLFELGAGNMPGAPPLLHGPGPRLLNLLWAIIAQLGWAVDDGSQAATSVYVNRELLIALQWSSLTLMAVPFFWTLVARAARWIPSKPVEYLLEDIPYPLSTEMRFLSDAECSAVAMALLAVWLFLGRWTERWTYRDFTRAMLEHVLPEPFHSSTFLGRLHDRYKQRFDEVVPCFLQRLSYAPSWNARSLSSLTRHVCSWRSEDLREHRSVFLASAGRGLMFNGKRWQEIVVEDQSSQKLLLAAIAALGSFGSSTPHFWMNVLTVFSCSISLGLSMSLQSLEKGVTGVTPGSIGAILKSLNLVTLVLLVILLGQLLGSSGGVLFLAEFVVTSISFILGGAGTISASSVESWGCFFCLSATAFWGYLFGRVALMDGITRQKGFVRMSLFSTTLLRVSLAAVLFMWILIFLWRWDVPASLMVLRTESCVAVDGGESSGASCAVAHGAAADGAAKKLQ